MGASTDLLTGLAVDLIAGIQGAVWDPTGDYAPGALGITVEALPAGLPDVIVLSSYPVDDDPALSDSVIGVQVRTRRAGAHPNPVRDLDDAIFDALHGWRGTLSTGVRVVYLERRSGTSLGQDENYRWQRASNYHARIHRPSPNRT